jgi:hypothetical protein
MKNLSFIFFLFVTGLSFSQTKGITYQAIIYNPNGEVIPGVNNDNAPMANKNICLEFSIIDASSQIEYQEFISTNTDEYGMVNLVIGNGLQTNGYASSFSTIAWSVDQKSLKVALDITGQCSDFVAISNQKFESVPYAFFATSAENVTGIVAIENGGTNATTVLGARTNLGLENVDNTSDLNKPISTATQAALDLKEDKINKSTATTLGTSDILYPTQNAVKTYVDASSVNITNAINNEAAIRAAADNVLTNNLATEVTDRINGDNILTTSLANEVTNRINADNTLTTNLATEVLNRTNADNILTTNLATEVTNRINADLLKEDLTNKSTATALGTSDILYPTQNAVKTYVDATSTSNTTALNNEAAIRAAADVVLTNNLAAEVVNRTNADLLKENTANKSTATTLGTSDVLFPSQNAVKTYVDASANTNAAAVSNEAAIRAAADAILTTNLAAEVTNRTNADLLKENLVNKSTNTTLGNSDVFYPTQNAVKTYVDASSVNAANALNNEAAIRAAADLTLTTNLTTEISNRSIGDNNLATSIATEVTNRTNADLLKENLSNKSTDVVLDGNSNTKYPSVKSIKDYVDASATTNSGAISNEALIRAAADIVLTNNLATEVTNRTNADLLKEDLVNKSNNLVFDGTSTVKYPTVKTVKDYVDLNATTAATNLSNEAAARSAGDNTLTTNLNTEVLNRINGDLLKENTANKSTATTLGTSDVLFPTQNAVKTYVDASTSAGTTGLSNEAAIRAAADLVLTNNLSAEAAARTAADATLTNDIAAEAAARTAADLLKENTANKSTATTLGTSDVLFPTQNAVKTYVDASTSAGTTGLSNEAAIRAAADLVLTNDLAAEAAARTAADATLTNDIAAEAAARTAADLLKENTANKSTATTLGTSDVLFPTQNAVKTYVDASTSAGTTGLNNEAAIRAAADVVLTNDIAAEAAARTAADATLTNDIAAEAAARAAADLLKENTANKSTATTLGTSDVLFPTQNAVKTYVDASTSAGTTGLNNEAAIRAAADVVLTNDIAAEAAARAAADVTLTTDLAAEAAARTAADLLKENTANKSTATTLGTSDVLFPTQNAVKTYVDASTSAGTTGLNNEAAIRAAADLVLTNDIVAEAAARTAADVTLTNDIAAEAAARTAADLLKENTANKSTATTLGTSDVLFPTQNAVKTYVDASTSAGTTGLNNEAAIRAAADLVLTNDIVAEAAARTAADVTLTNDIAAEAAARTAADLLKENTANKSTATTLGTSDVLFPTQNAVKTYVDASTSAGTTGLNNEAAIRAAADLVLTNDIVAEAAARTAADVTLTNDIAAEAAARTAADLLKENTANKSTATTLGTSDVLFPTQNAVKTYVDASTSAGTTGLNNEAAIRAAADVVLTNDIAAEAAARAAADVTLTNDIAAEAAARTAADVTLTTDLAAEAAARTAADLLKENTANKSTATTLGTSDVLFPTQNAVKTYVDASTSAGTTGLNNEAAIRAAADVVLTNDLAAEAAARTAADATLTNDIAAEAAARTAADLLKENTANKSTATTLGTSDVLFPTQNAVKTYVDASTSAGTTGLNNEAAIRAAADVVLTNDLAAEAAARTAADATLTNDIAAEAAARTAADLLKENTANKSTATTLGTSDVLFPTQNAVKTYVDASTSAGTTGLNNEAAIRAAADLVLTNDIAAEAAARTAADVTLTNDIAAEAAARTAADLLKENTANKSTATTLGTSDVLFPTQNAVKTYVDASTSAGTTGLNNEAAIRAAADVVLTNDLAAEAAARTAADATLTNDIAAEAAARTAADLLKENTANKSTATTLGTSDVLFPTQNAVKTYVDASTSAGTTGLSNEAAIRAAADLVLTNDLAAEAAARTAADATLTNDIAAEAAARTAADLLKENTANKSTATTLGTSDVLFPTQNAVKTYVDASTSAGTTGLNNEAAIRAAADVVLTNDIAAEAAARTAADATLTNDIAAEAAARAAADLLKENTANKSTATTLGTSDVLFPTQNAVKTYVDASTSAGTTGLSNEAAIRAAADVVLTNDIAAEAASRTAADLLKENTANKSTATTLGTSDVLFPTQNAVKTYVDASTSAGTTGLNNEAAIRAAADVVLTNDIAAEAAARTAADVTLTTDLAAEAAARTAADLLKENTANKSTATTLGTSDVLFPTQNAVKTYVDASTSAGTTGLNNEAAIRAAADIVLTNDIAAEAAARTAADATLTNDIAAEAAARTAADLLKENTANKSTATALGTSDVLFPTQNAVKTYVDASTSAGTTGLNNEAAIRAAADLVLTNDLAAEAAARAAADATLTTDLAAEAAARTAADLLKENTANKSTATALGTSDVLFPTQNAVKTYVDASTSAGTTGLNNEAVIRAAADVVLTNDIAAEAAARTAADVTLTNDIAAEAAARTAADLLKENTANKSTATTLGTSDVLFPTQNAVKTYVDASTSAGTTGLSNEAAIRAAADVVLTNDLAAEAAARTAADATLTNDIAAEAAARTAADLLKENTANKSTATALGTSDVLFPTQNAVKTYVDASTSAGTTGLSNEAAIRAAADVVLTNDIAAEAASRTAADLLKENTANKSTATTLGTSDVLFPTQNAVKTYVDASTSAGTTGLNNEAAIRAAADIVLTNDIAAEEAARIAEDLLKENTVNKSINVILDGASDIKFPSVKAVKTYVDTYSTINSISTITANYTALITDYTILSNSSSGAFTLTLPNAASNVGKVYVIRKVDESNNVLNFSPSLKLTESTMISSINHPKTIRIQSNGTSWYIID